MTGSINKKNRVGLWTQKLKIDLSNTVNKADTEFNDFIHSCFDTIHLRNQKWKARWARGGTPL